MSFILKKINKRMIVFTAHKYQHVFRSIIIKANNMTSDTHKQCLFNCEQKIIITFN